MSSIYSVEAERALLGGLLNKPQVFPDIDGFLKETDFYSKEHGVIYACMKQIVLEKKELTVPALTSRVKGLGIKFKGQLDIEEYFEAIGLNSLNEKATRETAQEVVKLRAIRGIETSAGEVKSFLDRNKSLPLQEIVTKVDSIMSDTMNGFIMDDRPVNIFEDLANDILILGDNPSDGVGLKTPYKSFDNLFGELRGGNVYAIASRPGQGKTTFLCDLGQGVAKINQVPVLYLDTEMTTKEIRLRMAASLTGVPLWYVETGNWNKNAELRAKMQAGLKKIDEEMKSLPFFHHHVGNKTIDEILTIVRRWYWSVVGRGNKCLIIYDYLKLTGEKVGANWAEYQAIGEKTNKLKGLSIEIDNPIFTAIQINRSGENTNRNSKEVVDDSSVIAQSDRVMWFVTFLAIFRRKTSDEFAIDGADFGTHKMIDLKTRYQGKEAAGHQNLVERIMPDGKTAFEPNYISFDIDNFHVTEKGTLVEIIQKGGPLQIELTPGDSKDEPTF